MRSTPKETRKIFKETQTEYIDSTLAFDDYKLHYIQTGKKKAPTLFFVHGSPGSWNAYQEYLKDKELLQQYRMIAVDRPGFGYSNFREAQDLTTQAKWLETFITAIDNQEPIVLIGHSMGGPVIAKMATLSPNRYAHLIILAGSLEPEAEKPEKWRLVLKAFPLKYLVPGALRPSNDELWLLKQDLKDMEPELHKITSNITIIHGTKDKLVPYRNVAFMQKAFSNAAELDTIAIQDANHFIPWEHYNTIKSVLLLLEL